MLTIVNGYYCWRREKTFQCMILVFFQTAMASLHFLLALLVQLAIVVLFFQRSNGKFSKDSRSLLQKKGNNLQYVRLMVSQPRALQDALAMILNGPI